MNDDWILSFNNLNINFYCDNINNFNDDNIDNISNVSSKAIYSPLIDEYLNKDDFQLKLNEIIEKTKKNIFRNAIFKDISNVKFDFHAKYFGFKNLNSEFINKNMNNSHLFQYVNCNIKDDIILNNNSYDFSLMFYKSDIKKIDFKNIYIFDDFRNFGHIPKDVLKDILNKGYYENIYSNQIREIAPDVSLIPAWIPVSSSDLYNYFFYNLYKDLKNPQSIFRRVVDTNNYIDIKAKGFFLSQNTFSFKEGNYIIVDENKNIIDRFTGSDFTGIHNILEEHGNEILHIYAPKDASKINTFKDYNVSKLIINKNEKITDEKIKESIKNISDEKIEILTDLENLDTLKPKNGTISVIIKPKSGGSKKIKVPYEIIDNDSDKDSPSISILEKYKGDIINDEEILNAVSNTNAISKELIDKPDANNIGNKIAHVKLNYKDKSDKTVEVFINIKDKPSINHRSSRNHRYYETSKKINNLEINKALSEMSKKEKIQLSIRSAKLVNSDTLVIANIDKFPDALSSQNLTNKYKAKLILIDNNTKLKDIVDSGIKNIYIIGGKNSMSTDIEKQARSLVKNVVRLGGKDRYVTNQQTLDNTEYKKVGIADGRSSIDALSAYGLNYKENLGMKLIDGSKPIKAKESIVYTYGGRSSVRDTRGIRLGGRDRYETNSIINNRVNSDRAVITDGENIISPLIATNAITSNGGEVILVNKNKPIDNLKNKKDIITVGIGQDIINKIKSLLGL